MSTTVPAGTPIAAPTWSLARMWPYLLLIAVSAVLHFAWYQWPQTVVLDEVYFPRYGLAYLKGEYFFDLHPPLGKLIYYVTAWLAGLDPTFSFATNQLPFPDASYIALRIPARLAGTLLPLVLAGVALELGLSRWAALVVGALAALDNGLLVMSRFALVDPFLLLFGFGAFWFYLRGRDRNWKWLVAAALLGGAALSVKWTGLSFVALILLAEGLRWLRAPNARGLARIGLVGLLAVAVYVACFVAHFSLAARSGPDDAVMSREFQATLIGNPNANDPALHRPGWLSRFAELHQRMFENTRKSVAPHAYASKWYEWPFMGRSLDLWAEHKGGQITHIYFLGNPVVWWAAAYCILYLLLNFPPRVFSLAVQRPGAAIDRGEVSIVLAYLANMLPFVPIARVLFTYHYLAALCVALIGLGYLLDRCGEYRKPVGAVLIALAFGCNVYFAPLSYGLPLSPGAFDNRFWMSGWR